VEEFLAGVVEFLAGVVLERPHLHGTFAQSELTIGSEQTHFAAAAAERAAGISRWQRIL